MKFNVSSKTLYNYLSAVSKIINNKNTMQILNNFLFVLEDDILTIRAADMENSLVGRLHVADAEGSGRFCLDARRIVELFKELPDQGIMFDINDDNFDMKITYSNGCYNAIAINGMEYPDQDMVTDAADSITFTCPTQQVIKGIENTIFAVGTDEIRPQMMGILWDVKPECIVFVAPASSCATPTAPRSPASHARSSSRSKAPQCSKTCLPKKRTLKSPSPPRP